MKFILLLGRILFSYIFIMSGFHHFSNDVIAFAASKGLPFADILVPISGIMCLIGGICILLGFKAKFGAWLIVAFLVPVTLVMHDFWDIADPMARQMQLQNFTKNTALLGSALMIAYFGAGAFSVDAALSHHRPQMGTLAHGHRLRHI